MLCPRCGYYADLEDSVCPECGEILNSNPAAPASGAEAIRQGKRARQAIVDAAARQSREERRKRRSGASHATVEMPAVKDDRPEDEAPQITVSEKDLYRGDGEDGDDGFERRRRTVYDEGASQEDAARAYTEWIEKSGRQRLRMVNWMKISIVLFVLIALSAAGVWLYLTNTDGGQRVMARLGKEASSSALWSVGEEQMNNGDVEGAIASFEKAKAQDEKQNLVDPDGLLMLASAYEAVGKTDAAAALYEQIYKDTPSRTEAYVNHIRTLLASEKPGDQKKAGDLMKTDYENTGEASFQIQRRDFLPAPPQVDLTAGYYEVTKRIRIWSYQGYDVYYTFDENAELPGQGIKYTDRVPLEEGVHNLRAVAVKGELVSDELKGTYKIIMPSPQMPQCNLAPGPYKTRQKVRLRPGKDNEKDDDIIIYYTVDGSNPDADCPIYTGEPVQLPSGHTVTIKAVAVNRFNKVSKMMEVSFKIEAKPYPLNAWTLDETIGGMELNKFTMIDFQTKYGEGTKSETIENPDFETECRKISYPWGYAVMTMARRSWVLVELYFHDGNVFKAPRGTGIGDSMDFVVGKFKDLGQIESASGNRGLYFIEKNGSDGKIWLQEDGSRIVRYRIKNESHYYQLEYYVNKNGTVYGVDYRYIP